MVKPNMPPDYDFGNPLFPVFRKTPLRIYVPKFYGLQKFGIPDRINEREGKDAKIKFKGELRPYQQKFTKKMLKHIEKNGSCIAALGTGFGKCLALNTSILLHDGSVKMVQDVEVGDKLMGDNSEARTVLSLGRGRDVMYEIKPIKGESFTCNSEHILSLKCTNVGITQSPIGNWYTKYFDNKEIRVRNRTFKTKEEANKFLSKIDNICNISVKDYLKLSKTMKHYLKLYRVGVKFKEKKVPFDPYILGFWIGDGDSKGTGFSNQDSEILIYIVRSLVKKLS